MPTPEEILQELHKKRDFQKHLSYFEKDKKLVEVFIGYCKATDYPKPEYASWLFSHLAAKQPQALYKHYFELIDIWIASENHTLHRNLLKTITLLPFKPYREGEFLDALIEHLSNTETKVAVKAYAMDLLLHFVKRYPEIIPELKSSVEAQFENSTPGFKARGKKFLKQIAG